MYRYMHICEVLKLLATSLESLFTCCWKIEEQASQAPCSTRLVDSFGGGLKCRCQSLRYQAIPHVLCVACLVLTAN